VVILLTVATTHTWSWLASLASISR